jgi:hypothetical protein
MVMVLMVMMVAMMMVVVVMSEGWWRRGGVIADGRRDAGEYQDEGGGQHFQDAHTCSFESCSVMWI